MRQLSLRAESILTLLESARTEYASAPSDSLGRAIHELELQNEAIQKALARIAEQQVVAQEAVEKTESVTQEQKTTEVVPAPEVDAATPEQQVQMAEEATVESPVTTEVEKESEPTLVEENGEVEAAQTIVTEEVDIEEDGTEKELIVSDNLKALFNTSRRRYTLTQCEIDTLIEDYATAYRRVELALKGYDEATSLKALEGHYADYLKAMEEIGKIADEVANRSDRLIESKMETYFGFADSLGIDTLRAHHTRKMENMEMTMSEKLASKCTDLDLAIYPHRLRGTMFLEADLARYFEPEIADSLHLMAQNLDCTHTLFAPTNAPKRANAKFSAITIKKKSKERAVSSLPLLKIPSEGELYSITVANYASLPPSTKVFRGATPLYREQREDGRTYIYLGMYPTARSAQEDIALLRKVGFKQPTLIMWRDGIRRDDWVERNTSTTPKTAMYRIEVAGAEGALPEEVVALIKKMAPRKEISKYSTSDGSTVFTVGIFTKKSEAQSLATAISKASSNLTATITQVGKR